MAACGALKITTAMKKPFIFIKNGLFPAETSRFSLFRYKPEREDRSTHLPEIVSAFYWPDDTFWPRQM